MKKFFPDFSPAGLEKTDESFFCLVDSTPRDGVENMTLDRDWLLKAENSPQPFSALRLYKWSQPTVSFGRNQNPASACDNEYCQTLGVPLVRRPTGGRAVFHADELTYAVVSNDCHRLGLYSLQEAYGFIGRILSASLQELGIPVALVKGHPPPIAPGGRRAGACFAACSRYEVCCRGRKIAGSAQRRLRKSFLQHGSIPLKIDYSLMSRILRTRDLDQHMISVCEGAGQSVSFEQLAYALQSNFCQAFASLESRR